MFETEIELARTHLQEQLTTLEPYVYLRDILNHPELDSSYKNYFTAEVDWWVHEEKNLREANPRFDMQDSQIQVLFNTLDKYYRNVARFDRDDLDTTIESSVKSRINYLCRPRTALKWFVFRGEPTRAIEEILLRMNFFEEYSYLRKGFSDWVDQRKIDRSANDILSVVEYERVIERIDNDVILDLSPKEFVTLIDPIFNFFQLPQSKIPKGTLPTEALIIFLDDKGIVPIAQELENLLYHENLRYIDKGRFLSVVDQIIREIEAKEESVEDNTLPLEFHDEEKISSEENSPEIISDELAEENSGEAAVTNQEENFSFQEQNVTEENIPSETEEEIFPEENSSEEEFSEPPQIEENNGEPETSTGENVSDDEIEEKVEEVSYDPDFLDDMKEFEDKQIVIGHDENIEPETFENDFSEEYFPEPETQKEEIFSQQKNVSPEEERKLPTLDDVMKEEKIPEKKEKFKLFDDQLEEAKFVSKIFQHDEEEYEQFVEKISSYTKWRQTSREVDIIFITHSIDPDSSIAREFRAALQKRFEV